MSIELIIRSILLGVGLAMDAFSVSLADGLSERDLNAGKVLKIAGTFAAFQFFMPLAGWVIVHTAAERFEKLQVFIPWIALALLLYIGGKMLLEGIRENRSEGRDPDGQEQSLGASSLTASDLVVQGIATSIDALSVGFTTAAYSSMQALVSSLIIGAVTLCICLAGLRIGRRLGELLAGRASILGGLILIGIGLEIWVKGVFF